MSTNSITAPQTLEEIDRRVIQKFPEVEERKEEDIRGTPGDMNNDVFESVYTSAHLHDCLIHAFLIGVSKPFRKLTQNEKNQFADLFRRTLLPELIHNKDMKQMLKEEYEFLDESVLKKLEELYKINIINFYDLEGDVGTHPTVNEIPKLPFIFVYNPDNAHFRAMRTKEEHAFKFGYNIGNLLYETFMINTEEHETTTICKVKDGDKVKYNDKEYIVEYPHWNDKTDPPQCDSVKLKDVKDLVPIDKITKIEAGGRRRRTRRARRNRRRRTTHRTKA